MGVIVGVLRIFLMPEEKSRECLYVDGLYT